MARDPLWQDQKLKNQAEPIVDCLGTRMLHQIYLLRNCPGRTLGFAIDRSRADVSQGVDDIARGHLQTGQRRFDLGTI